MRIVELIIDEKDELSGIDAISIVEHPAIESNFIALNKQANIEVKLQAIDTEKRLLMGAILIPNKMIFRKDPNGEQYQIYFTNETVRKASELYFVKGNQNRSTYEHNEELSGLTLVESWIVEDEQKDKSNLYNLGLPKGTWCGSMKVNNDVIWNEFCKTGLVKGFSIEGFFIDKAEAKLNSQIDNLEEEIEEEILAGLDLLEIKQRIYAR